jgi:hypothetical protein
VRPACCKQVPLSSRSPSEAGAFLLVSRLRHGTDWPMQIYANTPPPPYVSSPQRTIAGFWRRLLAFALDSLITSLPCFLLGFVFDSVFSVSTVYGGFIGFVFTVAYFGIFNSSVAQGQSLGQRMMKIQVVNRSGELQRQSPRPAGQLRSPP